jgi:hypothetical protein
MVWPCAQGGRILQYSHCVALFVERCSEGIDPVMLRRGLAPRCNGPVRDDPVIGYTGVALLEGVGIDLVISC